MHIALLCATQRGRAFLEHLFQQLSHCAPQAQLTVFSFVEDPWEPRYLDDIRALAQGCGARFVETRRVEKASADLPSVDLLLAVSWRYLIPANVFQAPRLGAYVFHDSLLPQYRGFAPTVWAILNGESQTGVTLCRMAEHVDAGDIVAQQAVPIGAEETIADVMARVTQTYLNLLTENLPALLAGTVQATPQDHAAATYTCKRLPEDNRIDWTQTTASIHNLIRAVTFPYPGAYTTLDGRKLIIWAAQRCPDELAYVGRVPGRVIGVEPGVGTKVLTGDGVLLVTRVQADDGEPINASELLRSPSQTLGR